MFTIFALLILSIIIPVLISPWLELRPQSTAAKAFLLAIEIGDFEALEAGKEEIPSDVRWGEVKRAFKILTRRIVRWKRQNAKGVARGLPPKPWPYHDKQFPQWDDPGLVIHNYYYTRPWLVKWGLVERGQFEDSGPA